MTSSGQKCLFYWSHRVTLECRRRRRSLRLRTQLFFIETILACRRRRCQPQPLPGRTLVDGDEQQDWPPSQSVKIKVFCVSSVCASVPKLIYHAAYPVVHLLLLKCSMPLLLPVDFAVKTIPTTSACIIKMYAVQ